MKRLRPGLAVAAALLLAWFSGPVSAASLLNVSYDVTREFYKDYNPAFAEYWRERGGEAVSIQQSHDGSSKQARAVANGLEADVVTLNQSSDIDFLAQQGLLSKDWAQRFDDDSAPFSSTLVFLVRAGNPKHIHDWGDLARSDVKVVLPNPKTSGNGRYGYLAAWTYALKQPGGNDASARAFVQKLLRNVPVLDAGGRGATTTFAQRHIGDVLITFESEVYLTQKEFGADQVQIVYPSASIAAELPVAVVDKYARRHGTEKLAQAYLAYLYSLAGQEIGARHFLRPRDPAVLRRYGNIFRPIKLYSVTEVFGGWDRVLPVHFADGGVFDQIYLSGR